jgi:serine/threonine protein kinase/tetratricopeptide (TPR) repeat protein
MKRTISHYELERKLGTGGSGVVYLANDTQLMRPVVLKILKQGALTLDQMRSTVLREARLASAIEHPNVCAIYEVDEEGEEAFIVMQYVPGQSLDKLIARGPATLQLILSVGIQIADGLSAAHSLGIFHRDLKPANVMLTDGGLAKILDFGLARRLPPEERDFDPAKASRRKPGAPIATYTARGGTIAYMAPEQFVTGQSSVQSDLWALGVILYELASSRHPFARPDGDEFQSIRAIQFADTPPLPDNIPPELTSVIVCLLQKTPTERYGSSAEVREALKTIMKTRQIETGVIPGDAAAVLPPSTPAEQEKRTTGILSMLAERFRESSTEKSEHNTILVLPFQNLGATDIAPLYGFALADALATRIARMSSLVVRPSSALMHVPIAQMDPLSIGQKLVCDWVLTGNFLRSAQGFDLNWQLLEIESQSVRGGGSISVPSFDLIAVQTEIVNEVFGSLEGEGTLKTSAGREVPARPPLGEELSEEYLQAQALLSGFMQRTGSRSDLERARQLFEAVSQRDSTFAPAFTGLGIAELQFVRYGFGGQLHVMAARKALDRALELDPNSVNANLYRVYMLLSRGEKESARHGIEHLLRTAANDWNVHLVAGITLRIDGMYDEALSQFHRALMLNPASAAVVYNHRARVYQYQNQLELAEEELQKGLTLEPRYPLLRTSLAYQRMRQGDLHQAIHILEEVIRDDAFMRIAVPTLAMCYVMMDDRQRAASLIAEETMSAAEADSEMAYRLATYFAVDGDESEALHWLRRAIYLGNENYPWFSKNPAWNRLKEHTDFERILDDLRKSYRRNQKTWKRLLSESAG